MNSTEDVGCKYEKLLILGNRKGNMHQVLVFSVCEGFFTASDTE